jgi:hypothetical protein
LQIAGVGLGTLISILNIGNLVKISLKSINWDFTAYLVLISVNAWVSGPNTAHSRGLSAVRTAHAELVLNYPEGQQGGTVVLRDVAQPLCTNKQTPKCHVGSSLTNSIGSSCSS